MEDSLGLGRVADGGRGKQSSRCEPLSTPYSAATRSQWHLPGSPRSFQVFFFRVHIRMRHFVCHSHSTSADSLGSQQSALQRGQHSATVLRTVSAPETKIVLTTMVSNTICQLWISGVLEYWSPRNKPLCRTPQPLICSVVLYLFLLPRPTVVVAVGFSAANRMLWEFLHSAAVAAAASVGVTAAGTHITTHFIW